MPFVQVHALEGASTEQKRRLAEGITDALCAAYGIGREIVTIYITEVPLAGYAHAGVVGAAAEVKRPFIQVHALVRPIERRRDVVRRLTDATAAALDISPDVPAVYILETPKTHIAHGGVLASDQGRG